MTHITRLAPAKLNLCLYITGQRQDGYHLLQSLFVLLDYADELHFITRNDSDIHRLGGLPGLAEHDDLTIRAAQLLKPYARHYCGIDIKIDKRIPAGGGLGGGSSDAATTLLALNELWQCELPLPKLAELGLQLGADVPVFVYAQHAFAEGVGEQLTPVKAAALPAAYVLITPDVHVETAWVFSHPDLTRDTVSRSMADILSLLPTAQTLTQGTAAQCRLTQCRLNDCEPVVTQAFPLIQQALDTLRTFGPAQLTGTGSTVFLPCADLNRAQHIVAQLPPALGAHAVAINPSA